MTSSPGLDLFQLMPAMYRRDDAYGGGALAAFLGTLSEEAEVLKRDIDRLLDDLFVETCRDWALPYIGDLVGNRPLPPAGLSPRGDVAKTVWFQRRRATYPMLAELARTLTGWTVHVVPGRARVARAAMPILGAARPSTVDLRQAPWAGGEPFRPWAQSADLRTGEPPAAHHTAASVTVYCWPVRSYPLDDIEPAPAGIPGIRAFTVDPHGTDRPLFVRPTAADNGAATGAMSVPRAIDPSELARDLDEVRCAAKPASTLFGLGQSLAVRMQGTPLPAESVVAMDLTTWRKPPTHATWRDANGISHRTRCRLGIDVRTGRIVVPDGEAGGLRVDASVGLPEPIGGGSYFQARPEMDDAHRFTVSQATPDENEPPPWPVVSSLRAALAAWRNAVPDGGSKAIIRVAGNGLFPVPDILLRPGDELTIEAAPGDRPALRRAAPWKISVDDGDANLSLAGLAISAGLVLTGRLGVRIDHCTLHGGRTVRAPAITGIHVVDLELELERSVVGPIQLPAVGATVRASGSIIDAGLGRAGSAAYCGPAQANGPPSKGAPLQLVQCTVFGQVHTVELQACTGSIVADGAYVLRPYGSMDHSFVEAAGGPVQGPGCLPGAAPASKASPPRPLFESRILGHPLYAKLLTDCDKAILEGGKDGEEMGAYGPFRQGFRSRNLRTRIEEFFPPSTDIRIIDASRQPS